MTIIPSDHPILQRMRKPGPKRILCCDGGGIRGLISVGILARLEQDLRRQLGRPELVLGDYFDFICGTSTGGIIATCLSCGMSVAQIREFYVDHGARMFERSKWGIELRDRYKAEPLERLLQTVLQRQLDSRPAADGQGLTAGEAMPLQLGDTRMTGLLMLVMRNHSTDSPWPVTNNPLATYNQLDRVDCNLHLPLWQLVRASTAAPTFFPPEVVTFAPGSEREYSFVFVDGGVTTYNNPSYLAFEMATASPYRINWATGVDQLLLVSVGTGNAPAARPELRPERLWLGDHAVTIPIALLNAATAGWDKVCRVVGECRFGGVVDREFGTMIQAPGTAHGQSNWTGEKQFAYVRYDPLTSAEGLKDLGLQGVKEEEMARMDDVSLIPDLEAVGKAYAGKYVNLDHLTGFV